MAKVYFDSETCGLHGMAVLFQYAIEDGPVELHEVWRRPVEDTLHLIESFLEHDMVMFNGVFDWFHVVKIYTIFTSCPMDWIPEDHIREIAELEEQARFKNLCIKPKGILDIMLHARKGHLQSLMSRDDINIRRVPAPLADGIAQRLEKLITFDDIYFARSKDPNAPRWRIYEVKDPETGRNRPDLRDIKLKFKASGALKNLARHAFKLEKPILFRDIECRMYPVELGYAPFAKAVVWKNPGDVNEATPWAGAWPDVIHHHIQHWAYNSDARDYAARDVVLTRRLDIEYFGNIPPGDDDSTLCAMVANCRWHGYAIDIPEIKRLRAAAKIRATNTPTAAKQAGIYIKQVMAPEEQLTFTSTKKAVLEFMTTDSYWKDEAGGLLPAAARALEVLEARKAKKEIEVYDKLLLAKRLHASLKIIGALSSRMAGADGINVQGINHNEIVRAAFPLADNDLELLSIVTGIPVAELEGMKDVLMTLCGGDFSGYEVSLADVVFNDPKLRDFLRSGQKIHAVMAEHLFPHRSKEQIMASKGHTELFPEGDMYDKGKKGVFLIFYGGDENTLLNKLAIPLEIGIAAMNWLRSEWPGIQRFQREIIEEFAALRQPGGIGTQVEWHEPKGFVESFLGFRRYFTLEHKIAKLLFGLAQDPPPEWRKLPIKVSRRKDKLQTASGAAQSALYGAAFNIISSTIRQATNHKIQSPGAQILKNMQRRIWDLQPVGVSPFLVMPLNIHDECMCPTKLGMQNIVQAVVNEGVAHFQKQVPLLSIEWFNDIPNWASKGGPKKSKTEVKGKEAEANDSNSGVQSPIGPAELALSA